MLFDINGDGRPERLAWTDPGKDVGFLAVDRNANGAIDDGEELFGNATPMDEASPVVRATNGFEVLTALDGPDVKDGVVDASDAAFKRLLIWVDRNHDGVSQSNELARAMDLGLVGIETRYRSGKRRDSNGNEYRLRGISWWKRAGARKAQARLIYDVWLATRETR